MFLLTCCHVGFLSAKVLQCNGLLDGGAYIQGGGASNQICVKVSNLMGL